tara:strand:- start:2687 stop:3979 length:1293 start_codon:yes stop_codon:yes gene_type:complete
MNQYDSEKINQLLKNIGFEETNDIENSDLAILNTCHIRERASEKMYSDLGRLSKFKENKEINGRKMQIIVTGCVAQAEADEILKRSKSVDFVLGPQNFHVLPDILKKERKRFNNFLPDEKFKSLAQLKTDSKNVSKMVTIQEGCDKFCSFCVVPYTRGAEYSRSIEQINAEVINLSKSGAREVTLLGQNVSSYSSKIFSEKKNKKVGISFLLRVLSKIKDIKRLRYVTSHPNDIGDDLIYEHKLNTKLMPFLHLPIQSGSNKILKEMNRKHTREFYIELIKKIRFHVPEIAFSSDFIVGYPGENNRDFEMTLDLIDTVRFASSYSFKYSPRPGTKSSLIKNNISEETSSARLKKLQEVLNLHQKEFNEKFIGKTVEILINSRGRKDCQFTGRTPHLQPVHVFSKRNIIGELMMVKIESLTSYSFHGKILN